jgi:hypothetical protein
MTNIQATPCNFLIPWGKVPVEKYSINFLQINNIGNSPCLRLVALGASFSPLDLWHGPGPSQRS